MKHPLTRELYDYWNGRRGDGTMPERSDIDPAAIRRILADSFVLAAEPGEDPRFRVAGTRICALLGGELRGKDFVSIWRDAHVRQARGLLSVVADEGIGVLAGATMQVDREHACALELLVLPLSHHGKGGLRMLGSLAALERPYWLGMWPARHLGLGAVRFVGAEIYAPPAPEDAARRIRVKLRAAIRAAGDRPGSP